MAQQSSSYSSNYYNNNNNISSHNLNQNQAEQYLQHSYNNTTSQQLQDLQAELERLYASKEKQQQEIEGIKKKLLDEKKSLPPGVNSAAVKTDPAKRKQLLEYCQMLRQSNGRVAVEESKEQTQIKLLQAAVVKDDKRIQSVSKRIQQLQQKLYTEQAQALSSSSSSYHNYNYAASGHYSDQSSYYGN